MTDRSSYSLQHSTFSEPTNVRVTDNEMLIVRSSDIESAPGLLVYRELRESARTGNGESVPNGKLVFICLCL